MECDREEAYRAKEIAEKKLMVGDVEGSYEFAQKAYRLYPALEGLFPMITAIEVHLAAHSKLYAGSKDWYAILQVSSSSDPASIKKQYKKLALLLHPDKNKSVGAEGAFKLITKAWEFLSDKTKKSSYDVKRKRQGSSSPSKTNVIILPGLPNTPTTSISLEVSSTPTATMPNDSNVRNSSDVQYPFTFTGTGVTSEKTATVNSFLETSMFNDHNYDRVHDHGEDTPTPPNRAFNEQDSSVASTNTNTTNLKSSNGHNSSAATQLSTGNKPTFWTLCFSCQLLQECPQSQERHSIQCSGCRCQFVAAEVATISVNDYTNGLSKSSKEEKASITEEYVMNGNEDDEPKQNFTNYAAEHSKNAKRGTQKVKGKSKKRRKSNSVPFKEDPDVKIVDPLSLHVRDADFYNFDQDRVEFCFEVNQIWAIYDDDDGMPRYYALINNVVSLHPFKVQMSWLDIKDNSNKDLIKWADAGFWRACGEFEVGRKTTTEFLNVFSHVMRGEKAVAGLVKIFPRKGSVWAIYRDWQSDWDENTPEDVRHKYEMVEVITDFTEKLGGSVLPLAKLDGFTTVYHRKQMGSQAVRWVLKTEFLRFSHQIPARRLLGNEAQQLPKGCWELDPAAMPMD